MKKAKLVNKPENLYPNLKNGMVFKVSSTHKGTHYYIYKLDGAFKGCFPTEWFELLAETIVNASSLQQEQFEQLSFF